ncbi:MAG: PepSY-associated TM helix domain-containing protein [Fimbriimonas sp.]
MYQKLRQWHRTIGILNAAFLLLISLTGFLLATKSRVNWIRPEEKRGATVTSYERVVSVDRAMTAAFAVGLPELKSPKDIDRVDYRPKRNVYKIVSREGYQEVQVDGSTGEVLQVAKRTDQFVEDLHDLSLMGDVFHQWVLPIVAISLGALSISGIWIWTVPILRRRKFERERSKPG